MFNNRDDDLWIRPFNETEEDKDKSASFDDELAQDDNYAMDCMDRARDMQLTLTKGF